MANKPPAKNTWGRPSKELNNDGNSTGLFGNVPLAFHSSATSPHPISNVPAGFTRVTTVPARWFDASAFDAVRVVVTTSTATFDGAEFVAIYTATPWDAASWKIAGLTDDQVGDPAHDPVCPMHVFGEQQGGFVFMAEDSRKDVCWHIATRGGDGATDGAFDYIGLEFGRTGAPPTVLVPWYLRALFSAADLSLLAEAPYTVGSGTLINQIPPWPAPRPAFNPAPVGGLTSDIANVMQLKREKSVASGASYQKHHPNVGPWDPGNFATTIGRWSTPELKMQNVRRFTAVLHHVTWRPGATGASWAAANLTHWRPGFGIVRRYIATPLDVHNNRGAQTGDASISTLAIRVSENLQILTGDRIVVEVQLSTIEDTFPWETRFMFDGPTDTPTGTYVNILSGMASRIDLPDFAIVPGTT